MKKRVFLVIATILVLVVAIVPLRGVVAGVWSQSEAIAPEQMPEIPDLQTLLNYPLPVKIQELDETTDPPRSMVIKMLMARPETMALVTEMAAKGFPFDVPYALEHAEAMRVSIETQQGPVEIDAMTVPMIANELSAAITAMAPTDGTEGFFQAHHTNLGPNLASVEDPPIIVNDMPYFYITTLRWIGGRVAVWHYWWFDSHHHPNWYYAHYYWYWQYWWWYYAAPWPYWYWWVHGWYYWRYWYFWPTWFPWYMDVPVP